MKKLSFGLAEFIASKYSHYFTKNRKVDFILSCWWLHAIYSMSLNIWHFIKIWILLIFAYFKTIIIILVMWKSCWKPILNVSIFLFVSQFSTFSVIRFLLILFDSILQSWNRKKIFNYSIFLLLVNFTMIILIFDLRLFFV